MAATPVRRLARRAGDVICISAVAVGVAALVSCAGSAPDVPAGPGGNPDAVLSLGREIWGGRCVACHGTDGRGGRGKKLDDGQIFELFPEIDTMMAVIANGKGRGMPAFGGVLSAEEIEAVSRYVREVLN